MKTLDLTDLQQMDRRSAVWTVCEYLSNVEDVDPSPSKIRRHYPHGSNSDVQKDLFAWKEADRAERRNRHTRPGMPASVAEASEIFWQAAVTAAEKLIEDARQDAQQQIGAAMEEMTAQRAVAAAAREETREIAARLDLSNQKIEHLGAHITDLDGRLAQETALRAGAEAQIVALREDLARKDAELHAATAAHSAQLIAEQEAHAIQLKGEQDRYDGMQRHLMLQTDEMRTQKLEVVTRAANEVAHLKTMGEGYLRRATAAEDAASVLRGKYDQQSLELEALRAETSDKIARLAADLAQGLVEWHTSKSTLVTYQRAMDRVLTQIRDQATELPAEFTKWVFEVALSNAIPLPVKKD